jgi:hypothetical protein
VGSVEDPYVAGGSELVVVVVVGRVVVVVVGRVVVVVVGRVVVVVVVSKNLRRKIFVS